MEGLSSPSLVIVLLALSVLLAIGLGVTLYILLSGRKEDVNEELNNNIESLQESEKEMINNIFEFDDKEAKDIMTHRKNMIGIDGEMSYTDAMAYVVENGRSRFPVFYNDFDHIIGILHIKDMLAFAQHNEVFRTSIKDIKGLVKEVDFVPETLNINELFRQMQKDKSHMVMVVDEYGQISGLVAMEDILEEIVGNIEDEHDTEEENIQITSDGSYIMDGMTGFEEVVETLSLPLEQDAFETLNGFLISLLDRIPTEDEKTTINAYGYTFFIKKVKDNIITEVDIRHNSGSLAPAEE